MSQSISKIIVHAIFATKGRVPFFSDREVRTRLHQYLGGVLNQLECQSLAVGGVEDHVHLLCRQSRNQSAAAMIKEVKRASSLWVKQQGPALEGFSWQSGYGIFSIGVSQIGTVRSYIAKQENHHRKISFQDEYRLFLNRYEVDFDERYVWD